jgi:ABC-type glutathione transport system ATPase component
LNNVSLTIPPGRTFALVGESGSGKSTLAKCLTMLEEPDSGEINFEGSNLVVMKQHERRRIRPQLQLIFQDAATAFNPRFSAAEIIAEPLVIQRRGSDEERRKRALELMEQTGLPVDAAGRSASEFSGGQRQRLAIARALVLEPRCLVLDEALSGLDLSIQRQIVRLLLELQARASLTYLFISHDLGLMAQIADQVAVMHQGKIVEEQAPLDLFSKPQHAHTQALLAAMPVLENCTTAGDA